MSNWNDKKYLVVINGKPQGPFALEELKTLPITSGTFVKHQKLDDFKEAHELPELRALLGFSFEQTAPQYFAGFDQRLMASAIDWFLIVMIGVFAALVTQLVNGEKQQTIAIGIAYLVATPLIKAIYSAIAESGKKQATFGKSLMSIRVGDMLGNRIGFGQALGRQLAKLFSVIPFFFGYLYLFLNKKQQCWHDVVAKTLVVKSRLL